MCIIYLLIALLTLTGLITRTLTQAKQNTKRTWKCTAGELKGERHSKTYWRTLAVGWTKLDHSTETVQLVKVMNDTEFKQYMQDFYNLTLK